MLRKAESGARLDRLPIGRFHWRLLLLIGSGLFLDAFDIYLQSGVLAALVKSGWSTLQSNAAFISATLTGMWLGSLAGGIVGDRYGRRVAYQFNLVLFGLTSIASIFAPNMMVLVCLRFVMGVGLGAEVVIGYGTLAEFIPTRSRGRFGALLSLMTNASVTATGLAAAWAIPVLGWRSMFAIVGLGAIIVWFMRTSMPESPRWLETKGRHEEADILLTAIEAQFDNLPPVATVPDALVPTGSQPRFSALFQRRLLRRTSLTMFMSMVNVTVLYGLIAWFPTFLVKQGVTISSTLGYTAIMGFGTPVGCVIAMLISDRLGRRTSLIGTLLVEACLTCIYPFARDPNAIMVIGGGIMMCSACVTSLAFAAYVPELFPTELRMRGSAMATATGRLASATAQFAVVAIFATGGIIGVSAFLAGLILLEVLALLVFGIDTRSRSLEQLAEPTAVTGGTPISSVNKLTSPAGS